MAFISEGRRALIVDWMIGSDEENGLHESRAIKTTNSLGSASRFALAVPTVFDLHIYLCT